MTSFSNKLTILERVRSTCKSTTLTLPQIVVIGDQSSGKSSLLSELSGIPFPEAAKICTKCPIVVHTSKATAGPNIYTIGDTTIKHSELTKEITLRQEQMVKDIKISTTPITIHAKGVGMEDLVLVDLPGIIHTNGGKDDVLQLIKKFIKPEQTLILTITEATRDEETALALQLAEDADPSGERTLRILTKFDKFDSQAKRAEAVAIIQDGSGELKPHAVICRPNGKKYESSSELLHLDGVEHQGIQTLKTRLPTLLSKRIDVNLPELKKQVREKLQDANSHISELGENELNTTQILIRIKNVINDREFDLSGFTRTAAETLRKHGMFGIAKKKNHSFVEDMVDDLYRHDLFTPPFFQGRATFNKCLQQIVGVWTPILSMLTKNIRKTLTEFLPELTGISRVLKSNIIDSWETHCHTMMDELEARMTAALKKETKHSTMNHYLTAKYENYLQYPSTVKENILSAIERDTFAYEYTSSKNERKWRVRELYQQKDRLGEIIDKALEAHGLQFDKCTLEDQRKEMIVATVKANTTVSLKTLTDNMMAAVNEVIYDGKEHWINVVLLFIEGASEDEFTKSERKKYLKIQKEMEECATLLNGIN